MCDDGKFRSRVFIVNDDDSISKFPTSRYQRLHDRNSTEALPEFAGRYARFVDVLLKIPPTTSKFFMRVWYTRMFLDENGRWTDEERSGVLRRAMGKMALLGESGGRKAKTIPMDDRDLDEWEPTPVQIRELKRLVYEIVGSIKGKHV